MIQPAASLVRYDNPVLISRSDGQGISGIKNLSNIMKNNAFDKKFNNQPSGAKKLPPVDDKGRLKTPNQTEDVLNSILPPRYNFIYLFIYLSYYYN